MPTEIITYQFHHGDGRKTVFDVAFDPEKQILQPLQQPPTDDWVNLDFHKCSNCPLNSNEQTHCPVAIRLVDVAELFGQIPSYEDIILHVRTSPRIISAKTTAQKALGSLMGLILPLSGCPQLAPLAPMARFHLPLGTEDEPMYRVTSMYLLSKHFSEENTSVPTDDFSGLQKIYSEIQVVNQGIAARIRNSGAFAETNSLAILDYFAQSVTFMIEDGLENIRQLFNIR